MKKKIVKTMIIVGVCGAIITGCKGDEVASIEQETSSVTTNENTEVQTEETTVATTGTVTTDEDWVKLRPSQPMEINLQAKSDVIGSFIPDGNNIYKAARYNGELVDELYCYFIRDYFEKSSSLNSDFTFPAKLEEVPDDIWEHGMSFWKSDLGSQNSAFLDRSTLTIDIKSRELIELNGNKFLREEVHAESAYMGMEESSNFVAYYYQTEAGQGVCVFGDRSEAQDKIEEIKEVADAIMGTFRMNE